MKRQPIHEAFVLDQAKEPRLPVAADVVAKQRESARAASQDADLVAVDMRVRNDDGAATVDHEAGVAGFIGGGLGIAALERGAAEIDGDVVAANSDRWA